MKISIKRFNRSKYLIIILSITLSCILFRLIGLFEPIELKLYDFYYRLAPTETPDERIVLVGITEEDIANLKTNRLSDWQIYRILAFLKKAQPAAVGIDIFRDHPVPPNYWELKELQKQEINALNSPEPFGHSEFISLINENANFFVVANQDEDKKTKNDNEILPPPVINERITDVGIVTDSDGWQRRGMIYPITIEPAIPSLSWALAQKYLESFSASIDGVHRNDDYHLKVNQTVFWKFFNFTGAYVTADDGGYQSLVKWRKSDFRVVKVSDILENKVAPKLFKDRIVIIGAYAPSLNDQFLTPLNPEWFGAPRKINGVEAIAQVSSYILSAVLDKRPTLSTFREPWISLSIFVSCLLASLLSRQKLLRSSIIFLTFCSLYVSISYFLFLKGYWIPVVPLIIASFITLTFNFLLNYIIEINLLNQQLEKTIENQKIYEEFTLSCSDLTKEINQPIEILINLKNNTQFGGQHYSELIINLIKPYISDASILQTCRILVHRLENLMIKCSEATEQLSFVQTKYLPYSEQLLPDKPLFSSSEPIKEAIHDIKYHLYNNYQILLDDWLILEIEDNFTWTFNIKILSIVLMRILDEPFYYFHLLPIRQPTKDFKIKIIQFTNFSQNINYLTIDINTLYRCRKSRLRNSQTLLSNYNTSIDCKIVNHQIQWIMATSRS
ncbi:CHASE2 domain-containing protein [Chroococcus sp. FPU101]|uniref:CHASE2 domain-containing protein n=1 Tax=Chroococcus sp. FPU101 TaxID=1974212 RepID=UPI001A8F6C55|nr:CHASE2 domain-containing protein [Chroococcus sp. FPU101]GFE69082.1 putative Chase2 sensor protein [Chroococcus sp. FPU101]